ncbi:hypothetical protein SZ63_01250 [Methanoculleus sediminis]|uniref:CARDB domain-containing protein n=1 Tax=Methanoculleus sediminis TaxID=1550566 RepID=A0A0H1R2Q9_9EURY|nr:hypothetical protein [Methanoculleus sediminis]KLK89106.1 hypothetical protein SZ63_01250 [Methanoculleus sediminis]
MSKQILILGLAAVLVLTAGCMGLGGPSPKVVEDSLTKDVSLSKGLVYNVNAVIQNDGADGDVTVTMKLIDEEKGFVRDEVSTVISIPSGETKKVSLTLDGDVGRTYRHSVEVS